MSKSSRLRLREVRAAFRLVAYCRDLGRDPAGWSGLMARGLTATFGCYMTQVFVARHPAGGAITDARPLADDWPDTAAYHWWVEFLQQENYHQLPSVKAFGGPFAQPVAVRREELIPTAEWLRSAERNEIRSRCGQDEFIYGSAPVVGPSGQFLGLSVNRPVNEPAFTPRERSLFALIHEEVAALVGTRLLLEPNQLVAGLSPRLREVLAALLEGDTEKQVATRLGLSRHTVHDYIIALYRRFGVRSRADLIRECLRQPGGPGG